MGFFKNRSKNVKDAEIRLSDEILYEKIAKEVQFGQLREGLWIKAYSASGGDKEKAQALYIELRKQSLIDEMQAEREDHLQEEKRKSEDYQRKAKARKKLIREISRSETEVTFMSGAIAIFLLLALIPVNSMVTDVSSSNSVGGVFILLGQLFVGNIIYKARKLKIEKIKQAKKILVSHTL